MQISIVNRVCLVKIKNAVNELAKAVIRNEMRNDVQQASFGERMAFVKIKMRDELKHKTRPTVSVLPNRIHVGSTWFCN